MADIKSTILHTTYCISHIPQHMILHTTYSVPHTALHNAYYILHSTYLILCNTYYITQTIHYVLCTTYHITSYYMHISHTLYHIQVLHTTTTYYVFCTTYHYILHILCCISHSLYDILHTIYIQHYISHTKYYMLHMNPLEVNFHVESSNLTARLGNPITLNRMLLLPYASKHSCCLEGPLPTPSHIFRIQSQKFLHIIGQLLRIVL